MPNYALRIGCIAGCNPRCRRWPALEGLALKTKLKAQADSMRDGLTMIEVIVVLAIIGLMSGLLLSAISKARNAAARTQCTNNLRQIGIALHQYEGAHLALPPGIASDTPRASMPYVGWNGRILPFIEQESLWRTMQESFRQDRNFLHDPPHVMRRQVVRLFGCPADSRVSLGSRIIGGEPAFTSYLGVEGTDQFSEDGVLYCDSRVRMTEIRDGKSNTLLIGERPPSANEMLGWWYAGWGQGKDGSAEMLLGAREYNVGTYGPDCPPGPYHFQPGQLRWQCDAFHFWSLHSGGSNFAFCDGSVRFIAYSADAIMPALATRAKADEMELP